MASNDIINPQPLVAKVKMLINAQLKEILKREGLAVSGLKSVLQERIISRKFRVCWNNGRQIYSHHYVTSLSLVLRRIFLLM